MREIAIRATDRTAQRRAQIDNAVRLAFAQTYGIGWRPWVMGAGFDAESYMSIIHRRVIIAWRKRR